jgi:hypothetical protein
LTIWVALINSSRGIIYASKGTGYAEKAREEAENATRNVSGRWFEVFKLTV